MIVAVWIVVQYLRSIEGATMGEQQKELRLEGIVLASRYAPNKGKQFLGAIIKCTDGMKVIDYDEQSPFHAFADRQVVASGEPYKPERFRQHLKATSWVTFGCPLCGLLRFRPMRRGGSGGSFGGMNARTASPVAVVVM